MTFTGKSLKLYIFDKSNYSSLRFSSCTGFLLKHRHNQVVLRHQIILRHKYCESPAQVGLIFKYVKYLPVVKVCMGEDAVNSATNGAKLCHTALLDGDPAGEVLVAVEETRGSVQCVPSVIYCWALLWCFVRRTQEYPLLCCGHLGASLWFAFSLELHCQAIQLHAKLPEMFVLPDTLVLCLWCCQNHLHILRIPSYGLLYILLNSKSGIHLIKRFFHPL